MRSKREKASYYANIRRNQKSLRSDFLNEENLDKLDSFGIKDLTPYNAIQSLRGNSNIILK